MTAIFRTLYIVFALAVIGGYGYASVRGIELISKPKRFAPQSIRGAHGGNVSFWYTGYRGGK